MKKTLTTLLTLLILLSLLTSCTTPVAPPDGGDTSGEETTAEQGANALTTPAEWTPEVKAFWDDFLDGKTAQPEKVTAYSHSMLSSTMAHPEEITDAAEITALLTKLRECNAYLTNPVSCGEMLFMRTRYVTWNTENGSFLLFVGVGFLAEGNTQDKDLYCLSLSLKEGEQTYTTTFELTSEQYSELQQKLNWGS